MFRRIFARSNLALALLGSLLVAGPAAAQQGQHLFEWSGGWGRTSGGSSYQGGYRGLAYPAPSYYTAPRGPVTGYQPVYTPPIGREYGYFGPSGAREAPAMNRAVLINVSVPANAQIWVEGKRTTESGAFRQFISPPLIPGREYSYDIKVRWVEDGKEVTRSRNVTVHAGDVVNLSLNSGTASVSSAR